MNENNNNYDCLCMTPPFHHTDFDAVSIGIDDINNRFGEVSILTCKKCRRKWLHYFMEVEGISESGRWYRGLLSRRQAEEVRPGTAVGMLRDMKWHFFGGSYFRSTGIMREGPLII